MPIISARLNYKLVELLVTTNGAITPVPFHLLSEFTQEEITTFCHRYALYQVPTVELILFLIQQIGNSRAIEIGAGNGCIGRHLGIKMYDSYLQERPEIKQYYEEVMLQPTISYGKDVINMDGMEAVKKYQPETVVGCWITTKNPHGYSIADVSGIEEPLLFQHGVKKYIHVGNALTHAAKPLIFGPTIKCTEMHFDWLLSRSMSRVHNVIYIFEKLDA